MALLTRYKKTGGFFQLLKLIETCHDQKQQALLVNIEKESPAWAEMIREKSLTVEKILSWDPDTLCEVFIKVQDLTLAIAQFGMEKTSFDRGVELMSPSQKRKLAHLIEEQKPSAAEIATAHVKLIETVRDMIQNGKINIKKIAPELHIKDGIEADLDNPSQEEEPVRHLNPVDSQTNTPSNNEAPQVDEKPLFQTDDLGQALNKIQSLSQELHRARTDYEKLKLENLKLKQKLMQASKILTA